MSTQTWPESATDLTLTCDPLGQLNKLIPGNLVANHSALFFPLLQVKCRHQESCYIECVRQGDYLFPIAGNSSCLVFNIDHEHVWFEIGLDMRHAKIVKENTVDEYCPLQICGTQFFHGFKIILQRRQDTNGPQRVS